MATTVKSQSTYKTTKIVEAFLANKTEKNWANIQQLFWFGLRKYALGYVRTFDDADDMVINTFARAYEHIDEYNPEIAMFSTWLWSICRNECLCLLAERRKMPTVDNDIADICNVSHPTGCISNERDDLFEINGTDATMLSTEDVIKKIYDVTIHEINSLPTKARTIISMKLIDNKKIKDISTALNMNESTIKNYLYDAKRQLDNCLRTKYKNLYDMYIDCGASKMAEGF